MVGNELDDGRINKIESEKNNRDERIKLDNEDESSMHTMCHNNIIGNYT